MNNALIKTPDLSPADIRLTLIENGYLPIPVNGKRPHLSGWSSIVATPQDVAAWDARYADHQNTGVLSGRVVAIDVDTLDDDMARRLGDEVRKLPDGDRALCRVGLAPKTLYMFRAESPREKASTPVYFVNGKKCQIEVLGKGQQFVAFGVHPETGMPYEWFGPSPLKVRFDDLPVIDPADLGRFLARAEAILAEFGTPEKQAAPKPTRASTGESFWQRVNSAALANPDRWVQALFPGAHRETGTGAWRVTSKELGRPLEEDISIHQDGIQDFGEEKGTTAISLAQEYGGAPSPKDAAFWLCDRLGVDPKDLGWTMQPVSFNFASSKPAPIADNDDLEDELDSKPVAPVSAPKGLPESLCYPPGAVGEFVRFIVSCSRFPSPHLSLAAALAFTAGMVGRRYKGPTGLRSNLYIVGLAESGFGKDITIRATAALADSTSAGDAVSKKLFSDDIRSLPGLANRLRQAPSAVAVIDEFGRFLAEHTGRNAATHRAEIATALMALTGATTGYWGGQEKAAGNITRIIQPCFSIHGISTPSTFWDALSSGNISEGLLGRLVLIDAGGTEPKKVRRPTGSIERVPEELSASVHALLGGGGGKWQGGSFYALNASSEEKPFPIMSVAYAEGVEDMFEDFDDEIRSRRGKIDPAYRPILNRVGENAARLAMIVAIGCDPKEPIITPAIQKWANEVAECSLYTMLRGADDNIADNEKSAEYLRVRSMISRKGETGITFRAITKNIRGSIDRRRLDDILISLRTSREIHYAKKVTASGQTMERFWDASSLPDDAEIITD